MSSLKLQERAFDVEKYVRRSDPAFKVSGQNLYITDPVCGRAEKLWVLASDRKATNKYTGKPEIRRAGWWTCYYCGEGGRTVLSLIERIEECDEFEAREILYSGIYDKPATEQKNNVRQLVEEALFGPEELAQPWTEEPLKPVELPASFRYLRDMPETEWPAYVRERGITLKRAQRYGLGICTAGRYANRLITPIMWRGDLVFFLGRYMKRKPPTVLCSTCYGKGCDECKHTGKVALKKTVYSPGSHPNRVLFNYEASQDCQRVVLVEDVWSAMAHGTGWLATLGTQISQYQLQLLLEMPDLEEVVLMWDRDATVRHVPSARHCPKLRRREKCADCQRFEKTWELAHRLSSFWTVRVPLLPDERDPDEHKRSTLEALIEEAPPVAEEQDFRAAVLERLDS